MVIESSLSDFEILPAIWSGKGFDKEAWGYTKAYVFNFLWFEITILI